VDGFTQVYGNDQNKPLKLPKITKEDRLIYTRAKQATCIEIKETLLLTPEIRTAVFEIKV
jgi:hypothetical protein